MGMGIYQSISKGGIRLRIGFSVVGKWCVSVGFLLTLIGCDPRTYIEPRDVVLTEKVEPLQPEEIRFSDVYELVLVPHCLQCHGAEKPADGINLTTIESMESSFSWPPVLTAGDPQMSSLYLSVAAGRMPKRAPPLSSDLVELLKNWIQYGAQE